MANKSKKLTAGCRAPNTSRAASQASAISVAVGMPQPLFNSVYPNKCVKRKNTAMGPITPPKVPRSGLTAFLMGFKAPLGKQASTISFAAIPKNSTINTSFARN